MAVTDPYADIEDYLAVFPDSAEADEPELLRQLTAVTRWVEGPTACGQFFTRDAAAVARTFRQDTVSPQLWLGCDLAVAPTLVKLDTSSDGMYATTIASTDYELWPRNAAYGPEARPWRRIDLVPWASSYASWPANMRVQVTAQWGWPAVPEAVRQAVIHLTAILRVQSPRATASIDEIGRTIGMSAQARDIVGELLRAYPRTPAVG